MEETKPKRHHRVVFFLVFVLLIAGTYFVYHKYKSEIPKVPEEGAVSKEAPKRSGSLPSEIIGVIRDAFSPSKPKGAERDFLKEEGEAAEAEAMLRRLIELDVNKDKEEIDDLLDRIRKIGYPAIKPLREMLAAYQSEKQLTLLLMALSQISDVDVNDELEAIITKNPSKKVRDSARTIYVERATPDQKNRFFKNSVSLVTSGAPMTPADKIYQIESIAAFGGEDALEILKDIINKESEEGVRQRAVAAVGEMGTEEGQEYLLNLIRNDPRLRSAAAAALGKPPSDFITNGVISIIEETDDMSAKLAAIDVLGRQGTGSATAYLLKLIRSSDKEDIVRAAGNALGMSPFPETAQSLIDILKTTEDRQRRRAIVAALAQMGEKAISYLAGAAIKYTGPVRTDAIRALSQTRNPAAYETLKAMLEDWRVHDDTEAQRELLNGLRNFGNVEIVPAIERVATKSPDESIRRAALEVAADLKKKDELEFIVKVFQQDGSDTVKRGALRLMRRLGDSETATVLRLELLYGNNPKLEKEIEKTIEEIEKRQR